MGHLSKSQGRLLVQYGERQRARASSRGRLIKAQVADAPRIASTDEPLQINFLQIGKILSVFRPY